MIAPLRFPSDRLLVRTRERLGPSPRRGLSLPRRRATPPWLTSDPLGWVVERGGSWLEHGEVVMGCVVQANERLFEAGKEDHPADFVYCPDPSAAVPFDRLDEASREIFALRDNTVVEPEQRQMKETLEAMTKRSPATVVPRAIARGLDLRMGSALVTRSHLPDGILVARFLPLLVRAGEPWVMPLPHAFWAEDLLLAYREAGVFD